MDHPRQRDAVPAAPGDARTVTIPAGAHTLMTPPWQTEPQARTIIANEDRPLRVYLPKQRSMRV